ncbi:hybrid sensor histidine kinase/response regulator transcription factor [Chitinophaga sp.]|uniref:hybrid sensor histidine kinase/response regulator transcription factor n=1 Tax=Chitinophaga sp. TaxID=1869181 RepID=UPI002FDED7DF
MLRLLMPALLLCCQLTLQAQPSWQFDLIDSRNGLSSNQVNSIVKGPDGFMWIGTIAGLNRYDGHTFRIFRHVAGDSSTLNDDFINQVVPGPHKTLWVQTPNGWNRYDPQSETFTARIRPHLAAMGVPDDNFTVMCADGEGRFWFAVPGKGLYGYNPADRRRLPPMPLYSPNVAGIAPGPEGSVWVVYAEGVLDRLDPATRKCVHRTEAIRRLDPQPNPAYRLFTDADGDVWIYAYGTSRGAACYKPATGELAILRKNGGKARLNNDIINGITQDGNGLIWIATDHGGVNVLDKKDFSVRYLVNNEQDARSISQNSVNSIYRDDQGIIWLGTFKKGMNRYHAGIPRFPVYQHRPNQPGSLPYNDVNRFVEDKSGNLWIGTNGGGLLYFDRAANTYTRYLHDPSNRNSISSNVIVSLLIDKEGKLWIGTYFGGLDCFDGQRFTNYRHSDADPNSLADDRVWEIYEDSQSRLWIGTLSQGLIQFDRKAGIFRKYMPQGSKSNYIAAIHEDRAGDLWLGTSFGIDVMDHRTGLFRHYEHREQDAGSLSHNNVTAFCQDSRGILWIATHDGLNRWDPARGSFVRYGREHGLPDNTILTLLEDDDKHLWLSTPNGLCRATVLSSGDSIRLQTRNFDESDGLQGRQFNENAALKTKKGELVFGGANGFNIFGTASLRNRLAAPEIVFTDLQLFNQPVRAGKEYNGRVVLPQSVSAAKDLTFRYNENVFTVEFAALEFVNPHKIRYAYQLKGFSDEWLYTDSRNRKATFTNLNPGHYTLLVKAAGDDGQWSPEPLALSIRILPPWWLTKIAWVCYALLLIAALIVARHGVLRRARARFRIERERQEAQRLHELDMMKIRFFTNVSHEFRTPLSLIISPVEKMVRESEQPEEKRQFQLIHRNARRLLNMVNQLLDFRKLEEHELRLAKSPGDIIGFIREVSFSFSDMAENKGIGFAFHAGRDRLFTTFDHDKLERVLFNLLSNAFKFTRAGGRVSVTVALEGPPAAAQLHIHVADTGIGIAPEKQEKIFERFFQDAIPGSMVNQGSGIGLSITKEFVRLHGGSISVESRENEGSTFTVILPVTVLREDAEPVTIAEATEAPQETPEPPANRPKGKRKTILVVEDNEDFRFYIKDNLKPWFDVLEAADGKAGWQKALSGHPDLIVSDISMPEMNGIDLCRKIRDDRRTASIPVILLTALTGEEQQLTGLETGASDYMTKPFNVEILLSRIRNLLNQQENIRKTYQKQVQVVASEPEVAAPAEDDFVRRALAYVERHLSDAELSVEGLSREMLLSRAALYKKLFALTGQTPAEFIRHIRLQRAKQLLEIGNTTVAEVAYQVGFNNPKLFAKTFREIYGELPSSYLRNRPAE